MDFVSTTVLAFSLAMDAFAVSISSGISLKRMNLKSTLAMSGSFGFFQAVMPVAGYLISSSFYSYICHIDHWIAFMLLAGIGGKMIYEAFGEESCEETITTLTFKNLMVLSIATSIDALAAGVSLSFLCTSIVVPALTIGIVTFALSLVGILFGKKLGCRFGQKMEILGGAVLIILGIKILIASFFNG